MEVEIERSGFPVPGTVGDARAMAFVDGENLAARYGSMLGSDTPLDHVHFQSGVYAWSRKMKISAHTTCNLQRTYYYTSLKGSKDDRTRVHDELKSFGVEAPRVFRKDKTRGSKRVDISLSVDMLSHAQRKNMDVAILVAGDEDYIPLVDAVVREGCRVVLWFVSDGLSPALRRRVDYFFDLGNMLLDPKSQNRFH